MKASLVCAALACAALGFTAPALAQSSSDRPADPATAPSSPASEPVSSSKDQGSAGSSADQNRKSDRFTHGESKRCESLSGAEKDLCDKEEATKTEGPAAREASRPDSKKD